MDIRLLTIATIWELRSSWFECALKLRHFLPTIWPPPSVKLKRLALRTLLCFLLRPWRCSSKHDSLLVLLDVSQVRRSIKWQSPSGSRSGLSFNLSSLDGRLRSWIWLSFRPNPEVSLISPVLVYCGFGFWYFQSFLNRDWPLYLDVVKKLPSYPFFGNVIHFVFIFRKLLCFLIPDCPVLAFVEVVQVRVSLDARHGKSNIYFQFQTSVSNHIDVIFVIGRYLADSHDEACSVQRGTLLYPLCKKLSVCFLDMCVQVSNHILSGLVVCWIFVGPPFTHLYPSESLVRRIWNPVVRVLSSERLTQFASVHI